MKNKENIFLRKKILIYGLGKSGIASYKFLKKKADVYLFDDNSKINKKLVSLNKISKISFDVIIISPCLLYTSPSPRDGLLSRMPSSA